MKQCWLHQYIGVTFGQKSVSILKRHCNIYTVFLVCTDLAHCSQLQITFVGRMWEVEKGRLPKLAKYYHADLLLVGCIGCKGEWSANKFRKSANLRTYFFLRFADLPQSWQFPDHISF